MDYQILFFCNLIKNAIHSLDEQCPAEKVDWEYVIQLSKAHNLLPVFIEEAAKYPQFLTYYKYEKEVLTATATVAAQVKRTFAFLKLYKAFADEEIHPIVMKGIICRQLYGRLCDYRPSSDEDILIRPEEYGKAKEILNKNGYVSESEIEDEAQLQWLQEIVFVHPTEKLHIELHLNALGRRSDARSQMSDYFKDVFEDYREVEIEGVLIRTMSHQKHLMFLILHAFRHFTGGGFGVRQMLDVLMYQKQYGSDINMKLIYETLKNFKAESFWSDLMHIGNDYFGFDLSVVQPSKCAKELLEDMVQSGAFGNKSDAGGVAARATVIATGDCLENKSSSSVSVAWKVIFPSRAYMLYQAPYLSKKPWLLPIAWIQRLGKFVVKNRKSQENLAIDSIRISRNRLKLLKKYDLV